MMQNICSTNERVWRVIIGLAILSLVYFLQDHGSVRWWGLVGVYPIGTAAIKFSPIKHLLGGDTCDVGQA